MKNDKKLAAFRAKKAAEVKLVHEQIHQLHDEIAAEQPGTPRHSELMDQMMVLLFQGKRGPGPGTS